MGLGGACDQKPQRLQRVVAAILGTPVGLALMMRGQLTVSFIARVNCFGYRLAAGIAPIVQSVT